MLKKYLLIICISIITFLIVPRETYAQTYTEYIEYSSSYKTTIENKLDTINSVYNYIKDNLNYINGLGNNNLTRNDYIIFHPTTNFNCTNNQYNVGLIFTDMTIPSQSVSVGFNYVQLTFNCENNIPTTLNSIQTGNNQNSFSGSLYNGIFSQFYDYRLAFDTDLKFNNNSDIFNFILRNTETTLSVPIGESISQDIFAGTLMNYSLPYQEEILCNLQPLGVVKNVTSFTLEVTGIGNALSEPLEGQFAFIGRGGTPILTNNYNISVKEKNNNEIDGSYDFQCNDEDIGNGCLFKYEYNYIDDIDTPLTLQFTFTSNTGQLDYEYSFYSCNVNNSKMNYTYIDNIGGNNQIVENPSLDNSINDDNVSESDNFLNENIINNEAFNQDHGITAIIQAPINFLQGLSSKTCSSITLPIPNLGNATIPCMSSIYSSKFNDLYNILKIIINGVLCYRMALSVVMIIKGAKDPNDDKIEVMDL